MQAPDIDVVQQYPRSGITEPRVTMRQNSALVGTNSNRSGEEQWRLVRKSKALLAAHRRLLAHVTRKGSHPKVSIYPTSRVSSTSSNSTSTSP